jgi:WhiB family redox-sensing transcriptional regulator
MAESAAALALSRQPLTRGWRMAAACRHADPDLFFPVSSTGRSIEQVARAKAVCADCSVRRECLQFALATHQVHGVWGGMTEEERQHSVRQRLPAGSRVVRGGGR